MERGPPRRVVPSERAPYSGVVTTQGEDYPPAGRTVLSRAEYREVYLRSEHWQRKRAAALEAAGYRCQVCNENQRLDVHHRTYERLGREAPGDLTVLCRRCHELFHANKRPKGNARRGEKLADRAARPMLMKPIHKRILRALQDGPLTAAELAAILETKRGTAGAACSTLRKWGRVTKEGRYWRSTGDAVM